MGVYKGKPTKDGRCWYFREYKDGVQFNSQKFMTKDEALDEMALFRLKKSNPINKRFDLIGKDYIKNLYKTRKESTAYGHESIYRNQIEPYFKTKSINSINVQNINDWKLRMAKKGYKVGFLNKCYSILNSIFGFAMKNYGLDSNVVSISGTFEEPKDKVIADKDKLRYITYDEFNQFIKVIDDPMWYCFFTFLYYTGMRKGEVQALTWKDINFYTNTITVNKTLSVKTQENFKITSTKNNLNRTVTMSKTLKEVLMEYKTRQKQYSDFKEKWFVFGGGRFLPQTTIDRYKHKYFELSGVREITCHEFRHSHVSLLINEYIKSGQTDTTKFFLMMSARLGHTIQVMQETYMHLFPSVQNEIVDLLDNL